MTMSYCFKEKVIMPDQDIFNKRFNKGWGGPAKKICKGVSPEIAAAATVRSLRHDLKEMGGVPKFSELYSMLIKAENNGNPKAVYKLFQDLKRYERNSVNRDFTDSVKKAVIQIHLEFSERNSTFRTLFPTKQQLLKKICENYLENQLNSKIDILDESEKTNSNWQDANFQKEYKNQLNRYIEKIIISLTKDPNFKKTLRFSRVGRKKISTKQMLHKPISLT